ncbi:MAG: LamG domain-containing protein [Ignavibacteria bacterium]|nr:LamG domain-containing protein [Ignavibacteria bacterium]
MATGDPYFDKVKFLASFDTLPVVGELDDSRKQVVSGVAGSETVSTSIFVRGAGSLQCATASYISYTAAATESLMNIGAGEDFTIEFWLRPTSLAERGGIFQVATSAGKVGIILETDGNIRFFFGASSFLVGFLLTTNTWWHVAFVRASGVIRGYVNGSLGGGTLTDNTKSEVTSSFMYIGYVNDSAATYLVGGLDDFRVTIGKARYLSAFNSSLPAEHPKYHSQLQGTVKDANGNFARRLVRAHRKTDGRAVYETLSNPSTGEFALNTQDASKHYAVVHAQDSWLTYLPFNGANNDTVFSEWGGKLVTPYGNAKISTAQSKFGGASAYFDGTGDYLTTPVNPELTFSTLDFTIEGWVRLDTIGTERAIFDNRAVSTDTGLYLGVNASGYLTVYGNNATILTATGTAIAATTWAHFALVKYNGTMALFLNGVSVGSAASSYVITCPGSVVIGRKLGSTTNDFIGYMDDLRIQKGKAQYVANFIPPTVPHFTVQAGDPYLNNVVFGCHFDGANNSTVFTDSISDKTITPYGNAKISTAQSKFGGASAYFDGSGDYLSIPHALDLSFGAVGTDFTIELFIRPSAFGAQQNIVNKQATLATATGYLLPLSPAGAPSFYAGDSSNGWDVSLVSGSNLSANTWYHLAATRQGSTYRLFVDGTQVATTTSSITIHDNANSLYIGTSTDGSTSPVNGYIDDLRITKGVARYTANFTPPVAPFLETLQTYGQQNAMIFDHLTPV